MQCFAHPTRAASNTCDKCNHWICDDCTVNVGARILCKSCANILEPTAHTESTAHTEPEPVPTYVKFSSVPHKRISFGLLFLASLLAPGANYMYMGLLKRGLAAMCGFFMLVYLVVVFATSSSPLMLLIPAFAIPIFWVTIFFDGFHIRRRINSGEIVEDGIGNILGGMLKNKFLTIIFFIIIALAILGFVFKILEPLLPFLLIGFAIYLIFVRK